MANTFQTGANTFTNKEIIDYSLFLGGLNVTRDALKQYDPLRTGFGRIFMIRQPAFMVKLVAEKMRQFKHVLEYANTGVSGNNNIQVTFNELTGGYTGRKMEIPNIATDDTNELVIKTYEFSGSLMREVIQYWINGVTDLQTGFGHYYGLVAKEEMAYRQANHTAEFIYVVTDPTGTKVEYACLFANCFPKEVKLDHFNYESGQHDLVPIDVSFTCTRYMSPQINQKATQLLKRYNILMNSLNFNSGFDNEDVKNLTPASYYLGGDSGDGKLHIVGDSWVNKSDGTIAVAGGPFQDFGTVGNLGNTDSTGTAVPSGNTYNFETETTEAVK